MTGLLDWLFDRSGLTPHGFCLLWDPGLIWTYALADIGIALAYFSIPVTLWMFVRRRPDLIFREVFWLFAGFILLCGTTHWLDVVTLWLPAYGVQAVIKAVTAVVSLVTAFALWRLMPEALRVPSQTQLREALEALRQSEARYRAAFRFSPVPLHAVDGSGVVTHVSNSWLELLGYDRSEVVGKRIDAFWMRDQWQAMEQEWSQLVSTGRLREAPRTYRRRDGTPVEALVSGRRQEREDALSFVCSVVDVTARRRAEQALRTSEERLHQAQKMEAVGQLTGGIAHDFNNMLQGISGGLDLMERRIDQGRPEEARQYLESARKAMETAAALTQRLLAFARRQTLQPVVIAPDRLVMEVQELVRRTVGPQVRLEPRLHDAGWRAMSDAHQLESALVNLAINARDAMPDGGTLAIATAARALTLADVAAAEAAPGEYVEIAVTDTGTGMTPEVLARAFEPFFTTKPPGRGTGLGLSQIYGFAQQSGGFVRLESEPGHGTTVRIFLPRWVASQTVVSDAPPGLARPAGGPVSGVVLLVDDEAAVRGQLAEALRDAGCTVIEAPDAAAGLRVLRSRAAVDMVVTDVGMPGMNGREFAEAASTIRPGLTVLLITGYAGMALERLDQGAGIEVLYKPFALDTLVRRVSDRLAGSLVR